MKTITFIIFLFTAILLNAQDQYYPFVDSTARWYVHKKVWQNGVYSTEIDNWEKYYLKYDTTVGDTNVYISYVDFYGYNEPTFLDYLYEIDSSVYICPGNYWQNWNYYYYSNFYLIFDFSRDYIDVTNYNNYLFSKYDSIVEAIGFQNGFFPIFRDFWLYFNGTEPVWSVNDYSLINREFACYERDGKILYQNPKYNSCWPDGTAISETEIIEKRLCASPLRGKTDINTTSYKQLTLTSINGIEVIHSNLSGADFFELNTTGLKSGLYILRLIKEDGSSVGQKVIVE